MVRAKSKDKVRVSFRVKVEVQLFPELVNVFFIVNTRDISEDCINLQYLFLLNLTFSGLSQDFQGKATPDSGCDLHVSFSSLALTSGCWC